MNEPDNRPPGARLITVEEFTERLTGIRPGVVEPPEEWKQFMTAEEWNSMQATIRRHRQRPSTN